MPYYNTNPWSDLGNATAGLNQSMASIALAQRQAQYRMQQDAIQNALAQQELQIKRDAEARLGRQTTAAIGLDEAQTKKYGMENQLAESALNTQNRIGKLAGYGRAPDLMSMVLDPVTGPQMMGDLRAANVVPQGQFQLSPQQLLQAIQGALGAQTIQQGAGTAGAAALMSRPLEGSAGSAFFDPFTYQEVASVPNRPLAGHETPAERAQRELLRFGETFLKPRSFDQSDPDMEGAQSFMDQYAGLYGIPSLRLPPTPPAPVRVPEPVDSRSAFSKTWDSIRGALFGKPTQGQGPVRVKTKVERDALPPGTVYIGPDGVQATKQ